MQKAFYPEMLRNKDECQQYKSEQGPPTANCHLSIQADHFKIKKRPVSGTPSS
jgi:hypothetical protein